MNKREYLARTVILDLVRPLAFRALNPKYSWARRRRQTELLTRVIPRPRGVGVTKAELGGVPCEVLTPKHADPHAALLYLHGGGFTVCSPRSHRSLVARLARSLRITAHVIDYRMAPEHPFPAGLEDCLAAYQELVERGITRIIVAGDSAGGGLTASLALVARDQGLPAPVALGMICPGVDLIEIVEGSLVDNPRDLLAIEFLRPMIHAYVVDHPRDHPLISPLYADLAGLPPIVLDSCSDDLIGEQAVRFAEAVRSSGGYVDHVDHLDLWHVFHLLAGIWPTAGTALEEFSTRLSSAAQPGTVAPSDSAVSRNRR